PALPATPNQAGPGNMPALPATPNQAGPGNMPALPGTPIAAPARPAMPPPGTLLSSLQFEAKVIDAARAPFQTTRARTNPKQPAPTAQDLATKRWKLLEPI